MPKGVIDQLERQTDESGELLALEERLKLRIESEDDHIRYIVRQRKEYFINCWHGSETESAAMWKLYAEDIFGIAIVSDFEKLKESLSNTEQDIFCGSIDYKNYENDYIDLTNAFTPALTKRDSFAHEREIRLLYWDTDIGDEQVLTLWNGSPRLMWVPKSHDDHNTITPPAGKTFACDLEKLIKEIRIAPTSPAWFEAAVRDFCALSGLNKPVLKSDLSSSPMR